MPIVTRTSKIKERREERKAMHHTTIAPSPFSSTALNPQQGDTLFEFLAPEKGTIRSISYLVRDFNAQGAIILLGLTHSNEKTTIALPITKPEWTFDTEIAIEARDLVSMVLTDLKGESPTIGAIYLSFLYTIEKSDATTTVEGLPK